MDNYHSAVVQVHESRGDTLRFQINVWVQINVQDGKFAKNNKRTVQISILGWKNSYGNELTSSKTKKRRNLTANSKNQ